MVIMYSKDRQAGGFSTYANDFGEGIMVFTYDKDGNMIPVWFDKFHASEFAKSVWHAKRKYWGIHSLTQTITGEDDE